MGGSVFGEAKPMVGTTVHSTIGLLRKRAATQTTNLFLNFVLSFCILIFDFFYSITAQPFHTPAFYHIHAIFRLKG